MNNSNKYKKGDIIVRFGELFQISEIVSLDDKDEENKLIKFKPLTIINSDYNTSYSIPLKNIKQTNIRHTITTEKAEEILKSISEKKINTDKPIDIKALTDQISLNSPIQTMTAIKKLWYEKTINEDNFNFNKQSLLKKATNKFANELAHVQNISLDEAKSKMNAILKKTYNKDAVSKPAPTEEKKGK